MSLDQSIALREKLVIVADHLAHAMRLAAATGRTSMIGSVGDVVRANKAAIKKADKAIRIAKEQGK